MMLFHASCPTWDKKSGPVPRFRLVAQGPASTRMYKCERCNDTVHVDVDWVEGAVVEPDGTLA
jgi:hypothetical protein